MGDILKDYSHLISKNQEDFNDKFGQYLPKKDENWTLILIPYYIAFPIPIPITTIQQQQLSSTINDSYCSWYLICILEASFDDDDAIWDLLAIEYRVVGLDLLPWSFRDYQYQMFTLSFRELASLFWSFCLLIDSYDFLQSIGSFFQEVWWWLLAQTRWFTCDSDYLGFDWWTIHF